MFAYTNNACIYIETEFQYFQLFVIQGSRAFESYRNAELNISCDKKKLSLFIYCTFYLLYIRMLTHRNA